MGDQFSFGNASGDSVSFTSIGGGGPGTGSSDNTITFGKGARDNVSITGDGTGDNITFHDVGAATAGDSVNVAGDINGDNITMGNANGDAVSAGFDSYSGPGNSGNTIILGNGTGATVNFAGGSLRVRPEPFARGGQEDARTLFRGGYRGACKGRARETAFLRQFQRPFEA